MNQQIQLVPLMVYSVLTVLTVVAYHFSFIDSTLETVVLTGTLGHLGLSYFPAQKEKATP